MSYRNWAKILGACVALSACAHGGSSVAATPLQLRHTDGPGPTHVQGSVADEGHPQLFEDRALAVELEDCNVWVVDHGQCRSGQSAPDALAFQGARRHQQ